MDRRATFPSRLSAAAILVSSADGADTGDSSDVDASDQCKISIESKGAYRGLYKGPHKGTAQLNPRMSRSMEDISGAVSQQTFPLFTRNANNRTGNIDSPSIEETTTEESSETMQNANVPCNGRMSMNSAKL